MKNKLNFLLICVFGLIACSKEEPNQGGTGGSVDQMVDYQLTIIKMTPELQDRILVTPIVDSVEILRPSYEKKLYYADVLALCNLTHHDTLLAELAQSEYDLVGSSPYILLEDGYAIIDWKWGYFHPLSGQLRSAVHAKNFDGIYAYRSNIDAEIYNEVFYLLPIHWKELTSLTAKWDMATGTKTDDLITYHIKVKNIESYGNLNTSFFNVQTQYGFDPSVLSLNAIYEMADKEQALAYRKALDELQNEYVKTLNLMIQNKDLDSWY